MKKLLLILAILLFASPVWGAIDFYVDCSAGGGGDGSFATPWNSVSDVNTNMAANKTFAFKKDVVCDESVSLLIDEAGVSITCYSADTVECVAGEYGIIDRSTTDPASVAYYVGCTNDTNAFAIKVGNGATANQADNTTIAHMKILDSCNASVYLRDDSNGDSQADNFTLEDSYIEGTGQGWLRDECNSKTIWESGNDCATNMTVTGNTFRNGGRFCAAGRAPGYAAWPSGIVLGVGSVFRNNIVENIYGECVANNPILQGAGGAVIEQNVIANCGWAALHINQDTTVARYNLVVGYRGTGSCSDDDLYELCTDDTQPEYYHQRYLLPTAALDNGSATQNPPNNTTGVLTDSAGGYSTDEHNGHCLYITSGVALGEWYIIDDTTATTLVCSGDNLYTDGVRSGDTYDVKGCPGRLKKQCAGYSCASGINIGCDLSIAEGCTPTCADDWGFTPPTSDVKVEYNIVVGAWYGIRLHNSSGTCVQDNWDISNNLLVDNQQNIYSWAWYGDSTDVDIKNNISAVFDDAGSRDLYMQSPKVSEDSFVDATWDISNNIFSENPPECLGACCNPVTCDTLNEDSFVDATNEYGSPSLADESTTKWQSVDDWTSDFATADLFIESNSSAINAGADLGDTADACATSDESCGMRMVTQITNFHALPTDNIYIIDNNTPWEMGPWVYEPASQGADEASFGGGAIIGGGASLGSTP
jgi:hypothetical protein